MWVKEREGKGRTVAGKWEGREESTKGWEELNGRYELNGRIGKVREMGTLASWKEEMGTKGWKRN